MIKLENVVLASPEQMEFIIEGMRNPHNSWEKSDSEIYATLYSAPNYNEKYSMNNQGYFESDFHVGENDHSLMQRLANAGTDHRKFMRMMPVYVRITAPLYWWKEFDTYKVGTVTNSCSTMHKIAEKEFEWRDFSYDHLRGQGFDLLQETIDELNYWRQRYLDFNGELSGIKDESGLTKKDIWWQMIQLLPSSYNQTRNVMMNYEVLANIYKSRRGHKLDEWREFCKFIESLPYSELICGPKVSSDEQFKSKIDKAIENYGKEEVDDIIDKICAVGNPNPISAEDLAQIMTNHEPIRGAILLSKAENSTELSRK